MQTPSSNPQKNSARRRSADPHARLSARLRHISFGAAVLLVVVAALTVIYSLYKIQIRDGATYRPVLLSPSNTYFLKLLS